MEKIDYKKQGRKNKAAGKAFEDRFKKSGLLVNGWIKEILKENL